MAEPLRQERRKSLPERLQQHPKLWARIEQMLDLVEGSEQEIIKAAEAERLVGEQLQQLGQETLQAWAQERHDRQVGYWERREGVNRAAATIRRKMGHFVS